MIEPRAAIPLMLRPPSAVEPSCVHVAPPSAVRTTPVNGLPTDLKLLRLAIPATTVFRVVSVGSNAIAPIDELGPPSRSEFQVGLAAFPFCVFQMPPLTVPTQNVFAFAGSESTACIAPATGRLSTPAPVMPATWPPVTGAGPCATNCGAPKGTDPATNVPPLGIRVDARNPGVIPAAIAAASTAD